MSKSNSDSACSNPYKITMFDEDKDEAYFDNDQDHCLELTKGENSMPVPLWMKV